MCAIAENCKKTLKFPIVQGPRSFKTIDIDTIQKLVISACYDTQYVCAYLQLFYASQANSGKIATF